MTFSWTACYCTCLLEEKKLKSSSSSTELSKARTVTTEIGERLPGVWMMVTIIISADILVRAYRGRMAGTIVQEDLLRSTTR
jgi:hypothetical protein